MTKNGFASGLIVSTDGRIIVIKENSLAVLVGHLGDFPFQYIYLKDGECDWVEFTKLLLSEIHSKIYGRKEAAEARLTGMLERSKQID